MTLKYLDHVNIRTARLAEMTAFYRDVLGMVVGPRPPFAIGGTWLYCGERAAVHLVEVEKTPDGKAPRIEHFAFRAEGLDDFLAMLGDRGIEPQINIVPEWGIRQVNIFDPEGNHIEIAFGPEEVAEGSA